MTGLPNIVFIAPLFILFEVAQLAAAERYLGVKQIETGRDPRETGPAELWCGLWVMGIVAEALWLAWLLTFPATRIHAACLLLVSLLGFILRNNCAMRRVLVILTIEGALRLGLMVSLLGTAWRSL